MRLRHATPLRNLAGIGRAGLLCRKSKGRRAVVWLHAPARSAWAAIHTVERHGGKVENVAVLEIDVPRRWLGRSKPGLWFCKHDIPPGRIRGLVCFGKLAASPLAAA
jgi:hypothetical protein